MSLPPNPPDDHSGDGLLVPRRHPQGRDHGDLAHRARRVLELADSGRVDSVAVGHEDVVCTFPDRLRPLRPGSGGA